MSRQCSIAASSKAETEDKAVHMLVPRRLKLNRYFELVALSLRSSLFCHVTSKSLLNVSQSSDDDTRMAPGSGVSGYLALTYVAIAKLNY